MAFTARSLVDPLLRECAARNHDLLLAGLAVHAAIRPQVTSPDRCRALLADHLQALAHAD